MSKYIFIKLLLLVMVIGVGACGSSRKSDKETDINSDPKFSIILGSGGGFTGLYEGYFIDSLRNVFKWNGKNFDDSRKVLLGKLTNKEIEQIDTSIKENDILSTILKEHGNMSTFLIIENQNKKNSISWEGIEPDKKVSNNVRNFYLKLRQIIDELQKNN